MPVTQKAKQIARSFAREQPTPQAAERVYRNTLAVCAVNNYLRILGVATNLEAGDSWNRAVQFTVDVADLEVMGLGRLECRPMVASKPIVEPQDPTPESDVERADSSAMVCDIPPEVQENRIGYVVVRLDDDAGEATLLGFVKTVATSVLVADELQPMNQFLDHLDRLKASTIEQPPVVCLDRWLEGWFEVGWQTVEALFGSSPQFAVRRRSPATQHPSARRSKQIELGTSNKTVVLIVAIAATENESADLTIEVYPTHEETYLPRHLRLLLLDAEGETLMEAQARDENRQIQFEFRGETGDRFQVELVLEDDRASESFVI